MGTIPNWLGVNVEVAQSSGGILALADPWQNLIRGNVCPWPVPEVIQKVYQSRQVRAFRGEEQKILTESLGFYSDLQSVHSEDAITWSVFGPVAYAESQVRDRFIDDFLELIQVRGSSHNARVWLWRRLPHPDTLVPGGPEIDFGLQTEDVFLLGEAKWRSSVAAVQGVNRNKCQLTLRQEFCAKYGRRLLPCVRHFIVLAVSKGSVLLEAEDLEAEGVTLHSRNITWEQIASLDSHPCSIELNAYLRWKERYSLRD